MLVCEECRKALGGAEAGPVRPGARPPGLPEVYAAVGYQGAVRAVLLAHKERGELPLARPLGRALAAAVREAVVREGAPSGPGVVLVPVPSARRQVRARGHDPARRIALAASAELRRGGTAARVAPVLRQRRAVADQSGLGSRQRRENLARALEICRGGARAAASGALVLVDDLITTGATLAEAARAVREAGLPVAAAAVVAAPAESFQGFGRGSESGRRMLGNRAAPKIL